MKKQFELSRLRDITGNENLIVTYFEDLAGNSILVTISEDKTAREEQLEINADKTFAEFVGLVLNTEYALSIKESKGNAVYKGKVILSDNGTIKAEIYDSSNKLVEAGRNIQSGSQTFRAMNGTTPIKVSTVSLFHAIEDARSSSVTNATVVMTQGSTNTTVWWKGTASTYYEYQFDQYYGSTTSQSTAKAWCNSYNYSHIINGVGYPVYEYCQSIKGSVTQDNDLIERNKGGYYFNFSTFGTYKKESVTFDLTSAAFKRKDSLANIYSNNWLIVGFKQTSGHTHEAGVRFLGNGSTYYLEPYYTYYVSGDPHAKYTVGSPIATGTVNNGVAKFNCRIKVTLAVSANGKFIPTVANLTTGTSAFGTEVSDSSVNTGASFRWFPAVTAVPEKGEISAILCDERNLSYMTGVKLKDSLLYTTASSTSGVSYTPSSSLSQYAFFYNTDCGSYSSTGSGTSTVETVSIFYNRNM